MSWSNALTVTDFGVMLSCPLTPVDTGASGSRVQINFSKLYRDKLYDKNLLI